MSGRAAGARSRRRVPTAVQDPLFEVRVQPELRFYRQIMDALDRSGFGADPLEAELVVAKVLGAVWAGQARRDGELEETFGLGLVDYARHRHRPVTVALLRTLAAIAPIREVRAAARDAADGLVASGLPEPGWHPAVGAPRAGRCWAFEDVFGDQSTVICEFAYSVPSAASTGRAVFLDGLPGSFAGGARAMDLGADPLAREAGPFDADAGPISPAVRPVARDFGHAFVVAVDHSLFGVAIDAMLTMEADHLVRDMTNDAKQSGAMLSLRQVDPAWARALLGRAFARTDLIDGIVVEPTFAELRAVAMARLDLLPEDSLALPTVGPEPTPDQLLAQFLASGALASGALASGALASGAFASGALVGALSAGRPLAEAAIEGAARCVAEYTVRYDPTQALRVGPTKWEVFVDDWLPGWAAGPAERAAVPAVVRAWSAWAARLSNLPDLAQAELVAVLEELFPD